MKPTALLVSLLLLMALAACKNQENAGDKGGGAAAADTRPVTLEPFTGALTIERVLGAKDLVKPFDAWGPAQNKLEHQLGKATRVDGRKHQWAAMAGDDCAYVEVEQEQGSDATVGMVTSPQRVGKDGPVMNYRDCLAIVGKSTGPAEDPAAPAPPADGMTVPAAEFRDVAVRARSKWKGQSVKVAALYGGATTATSGDQTFVTVSLTATKDDPGPAIKCALATNAAAPNGLVAGVAVVASGTVKIEEWMSMNGGDPRLEAALADCTVEAAPAR